MPETRFTEAYSKTTGRKQTIPKAWLERTDPPFNDFRKTPLAESKETTIAGKSAGNKEAK